MWVREDFVFLCSNSCSYLSAAAADDDDVDVATVVASASCVVGMVNDD